MTGFTVALPAGYRPDWVLSYHGRDPDGPAERVEGSRITKALDLARGPVLLAIDIGDGVATCTADRALSDAELSTASHIAARMLGVATDVSGLERRAAEDPQVAKLLGDRIGLRPALTATVWEGLVWAIVGQQVNLRFAGTLRRTLIEMAGTPHPSGRIAHPGPAAVARLDPEELGRRKFSRAKAAYLIGAAQAAVEGRVDYEALPELTPEEAEARLTGLKGIGPWTRQYLLLRACGFPDCVPAGDAGLAAGLQRFHGLDRRPTPEEQKELMAPYAPYRSLATAHIWAGFA